MFEFPTMTPEDTMKSMDVVTSLLAEISKDVALPLDHAGTAVLPFETCLRLIAHEQVGRVAFSADGEIVVLPVNHVMDGHAVAFRSAGGSKLSAAIYEDVVAFEVDGHDAATRTGWSVLVNGKAEVVVDREEIARLERTELTPWADRVERPHWVRIRPASVTGRAIIRP
jgi:nitroimidazol reductase NimA-like FMN-containing flavoprotein (pyridoxamine 5'-phosphate oxidase superfamily)